MAEAPDVRPDSSPGSEVSPNPEATAAPGVMGVAEGSDRPIENFRAEFHRKNEEQTGRLTKVERQLAEIAAGIAALTNRPAVEPTPTQEYTDQQLLELANAGNAAAHEEYVRRVVDRRVSQQTQMTQQQQMVTTQLQALYIRYPHLTDPSHALTQAAMQVKVALVRNGYPAQSAATDLEAIRLAIVDNPGLAQPVTSAPSPSGGGVRSPQQGIDGATSRRPASPTTPSRTLSKEERAIAERMRVNDPGGAIKRFEERMQKGRSSVSLQVAQILGEETK